MIDNLNATPTEAMPILAVNFTEQPTNQAIDEAATTETTTVRAPKQKKDRAYFRTAIGTATIAFYRSAKAVSDVLLEARLNLSPEEFQDFINEDCQFDSSFVYKLLKMAADYRLNDPANELLLPEAWTARYEIMLMKESTFRIGVTKGIIHAGCTLADLKKLREQVEGTKSKAKKKAAGKGTAKVITKAPPVVAKDKTDGSTLTAPVVAEPEASEAVIKAPVNTSNLRVAEKKAVKPEGVKVATKGRIAIILSREVAEENKVQVDHLKELLGRLVKNFVFIESVEIEVAA
jgi:hypothetical protein